MSAPLLRFLLVGLLCLPGLAGAAVDGPDADVQVRRFALIVGVNDGGPERVRLRYATSDALALGRVLTQLGGVDPADAVVLLEVDRDGLTAGLARLAGHIAQASPAVRTELFFYYSGHSDERGLLLGGERVPYPDLRSALDAVPADVRIAVLDSCASGAFTRLKGGTRRSPLLLDSSSKVKGHAFLTSSSDDEASQESDRLGGSFFTYALISGLRGGADHTGDGRVSLNEVYQFAFHETLRRTESTLGGPQHPEFDIQLAGSGDLVLTDLRDLSAGLRLSEPLDGRVAIRDAQGRLEVELRKFSGREVLLGLEPGGYTVVWDDGRTLREAIVVLGAGTTLPLSSVDFLSVRKEVTVARGDAPPGSPERTQVEEPSEPLVHLVPVNLSLIPPADVNTWKRGRDRNRLSLGLIGARSFQVDGLAASVFGTIVLDEMKGLQLGGLNYAGSLDGVQLGAINLVRRDSHGAQVGFVNVSQKHRGLMVGLVNIAQDADVAIGLLNFVKRGIFHVDLWASDAALINLGVKFGARYTYTLLHGSIDPIGAAHGGLGAGLGVRLPSVGIAVVDVDGVSSLVFGGADSDGKAWTTPAFHHRLRAILNLRFAPHFGMFFGPTINVLVSAPGRDPRSGALDPFDEGGVVQMRDNGRGISVVPALGAESGAARVQLWPGLVLGLSF